MQSKQKVYPTPLVEVNYKRENQNNSDLKISPGQNQPVKSQLSPTRNALMNQVLGQQNMFERPILKKGSHNVQTSTERATVEANEFIKKIKKEKLERQKNFEAMTNQKDLKFLLQFKESMKAKEKMAVIHEKDRQLRHQLMMKRLEEKRQERLGKLTKAGSSYKTNKGVKISTVEIQNANRLLQRNQY